jgi:hypothetical protein
VETDTAARLPALTTKISNRSVAEHLARPHTIFRFMDKGRESTKALETNVRVVDENIIHSLLVIQEVEQEGVECDVTEEGKYYHRKDGDNAKDVDEIGNTSQSVHIDERSHSRRLNPLVR